MRADRLHRLDEVLFSVASTLYWAMDEADANRPTWRAEVPDLARQLEGVLDEALPRAS